MFTTAAPRASVAATARASEGDAVRAGRSAAGELSAQLGRDRVGLAIAFASGSHAAATRQVAVGAREALPGATLVVLAGAGTLDADGEVESGAAVTMLGLATPPVRAVVAGRRAGAANRAPAGEIERLAAEVGTELRSQGGSISSALLFVSPESFRPGMIGSFAAASGASVVLGGGTAPGPSGAAVAIAGGAPEAADIVGLGLGGGIRLAVVASPAVRLITPMLRVTRVSRPPPTPQGVARGSAEAGPRAPSGNLVLELGGRPALDVLGEAVRGRTDRPLVLAALGAPDDARVREGHLLLRGVAGVDPASKGIFLAEPVAEGQPLALGVRDPVAAREDLDASLRELSRRCAGGAALAAICVDCAGRGHGLYGVPHVDSRAIRSRLPGLPLAGFFSSFEIAPFGGEPRLHLYTAVVAVLYAPS